MLCTRSALLEALEKAFEPEGLKPPITPDVVVDPLHPVTASDSSKDPKNRAELKVAMSQLLDSTNDASSAELFKSLSSTVSKVKSNDSGKDDAAALMDRERERGMNVGGNGSGTGMSRVVESALRAKIRQILREGPGNSSSFGNLDDTYALGHEGDDDLDPHAPKAPEKKKVVSVQATDGAVLSQLMQDLGIKSHSSAVNMIHKVLAMYAIRMVNDAVHDEPMTGSDWNRFKDTVGMPPEDAVTIVNLITKCVAVFLSTFLDKDYTFEEIYGLLQSESGKDILRDEIESAPELASTQELDVDSISLDRAEKELALEVMEKEDLVFDVADELGMPELGKDIEKAFKLGFEVEFDESPRDYMLALGRKLNQGIAAGGAAADPQVGALGNCCLERREASLQPRSRWNRGCSTLSETLLLHDPW